MKETKIKIKTEKGELEEAIVTLKLIEDPNSELTIKLLDGRIFKAIGGDAFRALREIRQETEKLGIKLLIQGCRPNCWPSGMSGQMSNGVVIYERQWDKPRKRVNTFDEASEEQIGTLAEQDAFNQKWWNPTSKTD